MKITRTEWIDDDTMSHLLAALTVENRLACLVSLQHGMRIGDVLSLKTEQARKGDFTYREQKTGKRRRVHLGERLQKQLLSISGRVYVFEHRTDWRRHRTRQAVWKDLKRVAKAFNCRHVAPHSCRKVYAVHRYRESGNLARVKKLLNHSDEAVTMLYAFADELNYRNKRRKIRNNCDENR